MPDRSLIPVIRRRGRWRVVAAGVLAAVLTVAGSANATAVGSLSVTYEVEAGTWGGGTAIESNHSGFTGSGFANLPVSGGWLQFSNVDGGGGGSAQVTIRFANGSGAARTGRLLVNGAVQPITTPATSAWNDWRTMSVTVPLNAGTGNVLRFETTGQDLANIDHIVVAASGGDPAAPAITSQPQSQAVAVGSSVTFAVQASGSAPLAYQWRHNGASIAGATAASYTIGSVQTSHAGQYTVVVSNAAGSVTSDPATLTVQSGGGPVALIGLGFNENSGSTVGNSGSASATFSKTTPPSWSANVPVNGGASSVDFGTSAGNHVVESAAVVPQLAGLSSFTVTGWVNNRSSAAGSGGNRIVSWIRNGGNGVDIVYRPDGSLAAGINQWPDGSPAVSSPGRIPTNSSAPAANWRFFAVTYTSADGTLRFYFGDNTTTAALDKTVTYNRGNVGGDIGKLAIGHFNAESSRASRTDRMFKGLIDQVGIYNSALTLQQIQTVQNNPPTPPVITTHPQSRTVRTGTPVTFTVHASGSQPLTYQWRHNNTNIAGATGASYTITSVQSSHAGEYTVVVSNSLGSATSNPATLTVDDTGPPPSARPRVIVMTDGEVDDRSSMIRFLTYTSDYDTVGIIQTNSRFQKNGHSSARWIEAQLDRYQQVLPNLRIHKPGYPDTNTLRSVLKVGNENSADLFRAPKDMATKDTPGSQLIIDILLDNDPRPVHVSVWGGANTLAYALHKLKTQYPPTQYQYAVNRLWIYCIWYQDGGGQWIEDNIPQAKIYEAGGDRDTWRGVWNYMSVDYYWKGLPSANPKEVQVYMDKPWLRENVKTNHGPLGAMYPQDYTSEGDTPSFLPLIDNGLVQHVDYTLGGWGGRPYFDYGNHMNDGADDGNYNKPYWRWVVAAQKDWAARMDWQVATRYADANHQPVARVAGGLVRTVSPGQTVTLDGSLSTDPDGNALTFKWWQYYDADSVGARVSISNNTSPSGASFIVPNERGNQIHIILEVTDNGSPNLTHYQRIVFTIV